MRKRDIPLHLIQALATTREYVHECADRVDGYTFHNIVGHPLSEVLHVLGFWGLSQEVHDQTLPEMT